MARETRLRLLLFFILVAASLALTRGRPGAAHAVPFAPGPFRVVFEDGSPRPLTRSLEIRIRDRFGDPIPDAGVQVFAPRARGVPANFALSPRAWAEPDGTLLTEGRSDEAGLLRVSCLPTRALEIVAENAERRGLALVPAGTGSAVEVVLRPTRRIEVVVRDGSGHPVEDVPVEMQEADFSWSSEAIHHDHLWRPSAHEGARRLTDDRGRADFVLVPTVDDDEAFGLEFTAVVPGARPVTLVRSWREIDAEPTCLVVPETGRGTIELVESGTGNRPDELDVIWYWDTGRGRETRAAGDLRVHGGRLPLRVPDGGGRLHVDFHDRGAAFLRASAVVRSGAAPIRFEVPPPRRVRVRVMTPEGSPSRREIALAWPGRESPERGDRMGGDLGSQVALPDATGRCEFRVRAEGPIPVMLRHPITGRFADAIDLPEVPPDALIDLGTVVRPEPEGDDSRSSLSSLGELRFRFAPEDPRELGSWDLALLRGEDERGGMRLGVDGRPKFRTHALAGRYRLRWRWRHDPRGLLLPVETREFEIEAGRIVDLGDLVPSGRLRPVELRLQGPNGEEPLADGYEFRCEAAGLRFAVDLVDPAGQRVFLPRSGGWRVAVEGDSGERAEAPAMGETITLRLRR
ncbi:MAG: hypothetical protein R3F20_03270 [Planctomycetota bacterium]